MTKNLRVRYTQNIIMRFNRNYLLALSALFLVYFFTAKFGLSIYAVSGFATLVWLPTGISLSALLLFGKRLWPAIFAAAFAVNYFSGAPLPAAFSIGVGNTLEAVLGVYLLNRFGFDKTIRRVKDALLLIFTGAIFSTLFSAFIGSTGLYFFSSAVKDFSSYISTFFVWWIGDMLSNLVIVPLVLSYLIKKDSKSGTLNPFKIVEWTLLLFLITISSLIVFRGQFGIVPHNIPIAYLIPPFIIWAGLTFTLREVFTVIFIACLIAVWGTAEGLGPFAVGSASQNLLILQGFIGVWTSIALILTTSISERKEIEKRKDDFISMASHELKTPVTSLKLYAQLLQKQVVKSKSAAKSIYLFSRFISQIDKLDLLVSDLLDVSKINLNKLEIRKDYFDLNLLIKEVVQNIKPDLKNHHVQIKGKVKDSIFADRDRIGQVITNLLTNAAKYSPRADKIKVTVTEKNNKITVSVRDFGIGIDLSNQGKIFEKFYRVRDSFESTFPGLGIGLYVSYVILKRHEGNILVKSKLGNGSTFIFTIPKKSNNGN
jgi:signal transduction histidine kinase